MCLGIPARILKVDGDHALADFGGASKEVNVALIEGPKAGDRVLIHAGFAIQKIGKKRFSEIKSAFSQI